MTLACDAAGNLAGLWFNPQKHHGGAIQGKMTAKDDMPIFAETKRWLDGYFAGKNPAINELPLAPVGGEFRREVWKILCEIPYGGTITYGEIAKEMALGMKRKSMSAQAVGGAVGHNPISIIIPCHRVLGANGALTGYAGGLGIKMKLLELEGAHWSEKIRTPD